MRPRSDIDPHLHTIRSVILAASGQRQQQHAESARFNLFAAFEHRDPEAARNWAVACRAALLTLTVDQQAKDLALSSLTSIEAAIDPEKKKPKLGPPEGIPGPITYRYGTPF